MNDLETAWGTGDRDWCCLGAEDVAVIEDDLPTDLSPFEGMEPGEIGHTGGERP